MVQWENSRQVKNRVYLLRRPRKRYVSFLHWQRRENKNLRQISDPTTSTPYFRWPSRHTLLNGSLRRTEQRTRPWNTEWPSLVTKLNVLRTHSPKQQGVVPLPLFTRRIGDWDGGSYSLRETGDWKPPTDHSGYEWVCTLKPYPGDRPPLRRTAIVTKHDVGVFILTKKEGEGGKNRKTNEKSSSPNKTLKGSTG